MKIKSEKFTKPEPYIEVVYKNITYRRYKSDLWTVDANNSQLLKIALNKLEKEYQRQINGKPDGYYLVKHPNYPSSQFECLVVDNVISYTVCHGGMLNTIEVNTVLSKFEGKWIPARFVSKEWQKLQEQPDTKPKPISRPDYKDVGLRVDRHSNIIFKPELVQKDNQDA